MILKTITTPNPILRKKTKPVGKITKTVKKLVDDMLQTMESQNGWGIAAPQVGHSLRVAIVADVKYIDEKEYSLTPIVLINPVIEKLSKETIVQEEGCLSVPGMFGDVTRPKKVWLKAKDIKGKPFKLEADDVLARSIQHELDHLDGILFTERVDLKTLHRSKIKEHK